MAGGQAGGANSSQRVFVVYEPNASSVRVGVASGASNLTSLMNQTMLTVAGHNLPDPVAVGVASVGECVERCASLGAECAAWSVNHTASPLSCVLLPWTGWDARSDPSTANWTSGVKTHGHGASGIPGTGGQSDTLKLLETDETIDIAIFT